MKAGLSIVSVVALFWLILNGCERTEEIMPEVNSKKVSQLQSVLFDDCFTGTANSKDKLQFVYNANGDVAKIEWFYSLGGSMFSNSMLEHRTYDDKGNLSQVELNNNIKKSFQYQHSKLQKILTSNSMAPALSQEETIETENEKVVKSTSKTADGAVWISEFKYDAKGNVIEYKKYNASKPKLFEQYNVEYDNQVNPLYQKLHNEIIPYDGFIDVLFHYSQNNPTKVTWNTSLCSPCTNVRNEYFYQYDNEGRPVYAEYKSEIGTLLEKITYQYSY